PQHLAAVGIDCEYRRHDGVIALVRDADAEGIDAVDLEGFGAVHGDERRLLEREPDGVALGLLGYGMRMERLNGVDDDAPDVAAAPAWRDHLDGIFQHLGSSIRIGIGAGTDHGEAFRPVAAAAHRHIDLQRIDTAVDRRFEWPQRPSAVEAEQSAHVL